MKSHTIHDDYIGTQFPVALEYGDVTGLEDDEERQLEDWYSGLIALAEDRYGVHDPVLHFEYGEQSEFETCDVTGLRGNCVAVSVIILV
jgi:hypothetical protein